MAGGLPFSSFGRGNRRRWVAVALVFHLFVLWAALGWTFGPKGTPPHWGSQTWFFKNPGVVPTPGLFDANVLLFGAELAHAGKDPLAPEFFGRDGIVYNYPSGWNFLGMLGLTRRDLVPVSWAFGLLFCGSLWLLIPPTTAVASATHAAILFSPASVNALGQANGELVVMSLLAVAAKLALRPGTTARAASIAILFGAALLKLYPAIGFGVLAVKARRWHWGPLLALVGVSAVFVLHRAEIATIVSRTPKPFAMAFGVDEIPLRAANLLAADSLWIGSSASRKHLAESVAAARPLFRVAYFLTVVAGFLLGARAMAGKKSVDAESPAEFLLTFGAILFIGTFGIGASWAHRSLVLVPFLAGCFGPPARPWSALVALAVVWCTTLTQGPTFVLEQFATWLGLFVASHALGRVCFWPGMLVDFARMFAPKSSPTPA